ncbi:hypothetical protein G6011_10835 [Alternaria panax]|uniref:Mid2 domain-containing protein n=1 Tax=Alternaria panax TaxID=48097 RepID=A0AAD4ICE8_9PLEO|nr:hypothetical protein G6011_10835 [Alternaria panax]
MIGTHVATKCPDDPSQNTTALEVFSSYCDIGGSKLAEIAASTTYSPSRTLAPSSASASPASTPPPASLTPTSKTLASSPEPTGSIERAPATKTNRIVAIAAGVAVPVVVLASALAAFFLFRRHKDNKHDESEIFEADASTVDASKGGTCHEVSDKGQIAAELPNPDPQEMDAESARG